jgi:hypothetical protein
MDWFKQNPFAGLLGVLTLVALLGSGYFLFDSLGRYSAAAEEFDEQARTLDRLQSNTPFPDAENVRLAREELDGARAILGKIGDSLQVRAQDTTPQGFQDQLRQKVNDIIARAEANGVSLGENFYLGFQAYETQPPANAVAASELAVQLQSIHAVASILVEARVSAITGISRAPLPAEAPAPRADGARERKPEGGDRQEDRLPDLVLAPFDVVFTAEQAVFRAALNRILEAEPPVFVRLVGVTNSSPAAPSKDGSGEVAEDTPDDTRGGSAIKPVLGRENLIINLRLAAISAGADGND